MPLIIMDKAGLFLPGDISRKPVLQNIDWRIRKGRHCAVLGPNGAGKSTLLRLVAGQIWATAGTVVWKTDAGYDDSPLSGRAMAELVSPSLQENCRRQAWGIRAREFLFRAMADAPGKADPQEINDDIATLSSDLDFAAWLDAPLPTLSQGQLRMILLARALLRRPELLLLDECLDGLDASHKRKFLAFLEKIAPETTMVFAGHKGDSLPPLAVEEIYLDCGCLVPGQKEQAPAPRKMASAPLRPGPPLISVKNASIYIDRHLSVKNVDWTICEGENWRITGPNGSGKSTLLRLLAGDEFAAAGGACLRFFPGDDTLENTRRNICLISDLGQALYGYPLSGLELVCSGYDNSIGIYRSFSEPELQLAREAIRRAFPENWEEICMASIRRLSSGQLRRLHLARALMTKPALLLLDEACSGLDSASRADFIALVDDLAMKGFQDRKLQIVFVSHDENDLPACLNREARMEGGHFFVTR